MKNLGKIALIFLYALICDAKVAPKGMTEFNKTCPTPKLCEKIYENLEDCKKGIKKQCDTFVNNYKKTLSFYDCQRSFDATSTEKYVVPASWLCESNEYFLNELSKMKSKKARTLYGSQALRDSLDGELAETHRAESEKVGKSSKK